ncbi:hypothetical protein BST10_10075 [Mycolicibacter algericus DSM 45454]|uniref:Tail assembly chaperone n=1 Tax=Mycolicibacter algericus DSM 45454 TaxID=723879 RepID=A0ABX3RTJ6_MYCAL|nr:hypothetical protein BST10_10075 [Mycolicibacter algericus DSM 45454]
MPAEVIDRHTAHAEEAREQADEYDSLLRGDIIYGANGEPFEVPHRDLFSNAQQRRWDAMLAERQDYDREDDITASDGTVIRRGDILTPFRKNKKLVKSQIHPSELATDAEQQAIAIWGLDEAKRADKAGVVFNEIPVAFAKQARRIRKWREADSKSADRDSGVAAAADSD